ncbi:MAG: hypothetical protein ACOXZU_00455 [Bacteroidales bacterium]
MTGCLYCGLIFSWQVDSLEGVPATIFWHRAQGSGHRAQGTGRRAQGTGLRAQGTGHRARLSDGMYS